MQDRAKLSKKKQPTRYRDEEEGLDDREEERWEQEEQQVGHCQHVANTRP